MWLTRAGVLVGQGLDREGPYLALDERSATPWVRQRLRPLGQVIHARLEAARFCTGRYDLARGQGQPCPAQRSLTDSQYSQCFACREATGFNPAFYNAVEVSPQQRHRNGQPHFVYLAHFGGGLVKVGMSYAPRGLGRLLEQGARMAAVLAQFDDAYAARDLEADIAGLGAAETVRSDRKRKLLAAPFVVGVAKRELQGFIERVRALHPELPAAPEILHLDRHYGDPRMFATLPTDLSGPPPLQLHGRVLGLLGDNLILEGLQAQSGEHFMCGLKALQGCAMTLTDTPGQNHAPGQMRLMF